jgi:molecular chaperone HscB
MTDYFERLGLPRRFSVDAAAVEREYLSRSRELHPDFHHGGTAAQQRASLELTAALNEAYVTLRDPFRRAEYLLRLLGGPTAQQEKNLDQAFLMEMLDLREQIEEAKGAKQGLDTIEVDLTERLGSLADAIATHFARVEGLPENDPKRTAELVQVRRLLNTAKTVQSLLRDLRAE